MTNTKLRLNGEKKNPELFVYRRKGELLENDVKVKGSTSTINNSPI